MESTEALIGLGSNLGDRRATLDAAVAVLRETPGVVVRAVSSYHETAPVGGPEGQGAFLNAAAALVFAHDPLGLLHILQDVERRLGRIRSVRWGERTIDLDLLLFGDQIIDTPELQVPHLRMAVRRFVLAPLAEIAPEAVDPLTRRTIGQLLTSLDRRPSYVALSRALRTYHGDGIFARLVAELGAAGLSEGKLSQDLAWHYELEAGGEKSIARITLEQKALEVLEHRWTAGLWGTDRWIVSDYWLYDHFLDVKRLFDPSDWRQFSKVSHTAIFRTLMPTFVVKAWMEADEPLAVWARQFDRLEAPSYPGYHSPILRIRGLDRIAYPDPLHDCNPDLPPDEWRDDLLRRSEAARAEEEEAIVAEVLAACAAIRAGTRIVAPPIVGDQAPPL